MKTLIKEKTSHFLDTEDTANFQQLDKANQVINQFIRSCSHSMRNPLKSIKGLVNLLNEKNALPETDPVMLMGLIDESIDKMENMLDELEQFMVNSSKDTSRKSVDVSQLILQVVSGLQLEVKSKSIDLSVQAEQTGLFISDSGRIRLILNHLLMNAIAFQKSENPQKTIIIRSSVNADGCSLSVEDNGIGIDQAQHGNIFKLFYRASANSQGAGIGLFVVREALEKLGGCIEVNSEEGKGCIFSIHIPNCALTIQQDMGLLKLAT